MTSATVKPSQFFVHRTKQRSGNLRADVVAPVFAIYGVLMAVSRCFARTKISHREMKRLRKRDSNDPTL